MEPLLTSMLPNDIAIMAYSDFQLLKRSVNIEMICCCVRLNLSVLKVEGLFKYE